MKLRSRALQLGAAFALCSLATACTQPTGPQEPTPTPTPANTSPTETQLERQTRLDFEAAEKAYLAFKTEYDRLAVSGKSDKATRVMTDNAAGPYLKVMTGFLSQTIRAGQRQQGEVRVAYINRGAYSPEQLNLLVCEDGTKVKTLDRNGKASKGVAAKITLYVRPIDGRWKLWNGDDEVVKSCDA
jgi:hypothetical protein